MEFAKGGELFNHIVKQKRLDESEAAFYFTQIICGLEVIHKNNIVHRDIKPENLLLKENNILTIIDFGLSNQYKQGKTLSTPCGSPCYAAPEMILGRKYNGLMVDLWSSGIVLYAMVCGYLPFEDKNNDKLYKKILNGKFEIPEHLSMECRDLLKKILTVSPKKRINLEDIKSHPFLALASPTYKVDESTINREKGVYNEIIIDKMVNGMPGYDFRKDEILFHLSHNKHNNITTTYELLLKKYITNSNTHNKHNKDNLSGITATTSMQSISLNTTISPVKVGTECKIDSNVYNVLKSPVITNILPKINIDATTSNIIATSTTNANKRSRKGFSVGESKSTSNENKFIHKITTTITTHNNNNNSNNNSTNIHNNKKQKHNKHYHNSTSKNKSNSKNDISLDVSKIINKNKIDSNIIICVPHLVPINKKAFAKLSTRTKRISTSKLISSNTNIHNSNNKLSPNRKHSNSSNRTNSNKNINTSINYETTPKRFHHLSKAKSKNMQMIYIPSNTINLEDDGCMNNSHGQIKYNAHKRKSNSKSNNTSKNKYSKCKNNNSNSNFHTQNIISIKASTPLKQKNKNYSNVYIHKITNENSYKLIHRSYSVNNNNNNNNDCAQSPKSDGASMKSIQFHNNSNNSLNYINKIYGSFCEEYINCRSENNNSNNNNINNSNNPNNNSYNLSLSSLIKKNKSQKSIQSNQSNNTAKTNLTISKNKQNQKQNKQIVASTIKAQPQVKKQHKIIHRHQVNININKTKENNHNINNSTSNHNSLMCNSPTKKKETINSTRASYCPSFTENMSPIFNLDKMLISNKSNFSNSSNNTVNTVVSSISTNKNLKTPNKKNSNISITIKKVNSSKRGIKGQSTSPSVSSSSSLNKRSKGKRSSKGNITSTNANNPSFRVKLTVIGIDITEEIEKNKQKNKTNITSSNTKQKQQQTSSTTSSTNKKQTNINNNNNKKQKQKSKESNSIGVNSCDSEGCLIKSKKRKVTSPLEIQFDLEDDVEMKQKILTTSKDLAICTVSSTIEQINEKLNILCQNNGYTLTEVDKTKYICKKNSDNSINIEISQVGNNNVLKLYHLNGQESITKEIIKNIIIHIGF